jgi:PAS domain S-box-containing protein
MELATSVLGSAFNGIVAIDDVGTILFWNSGAERILGIPAPDACGRHISEVLPDSAAGLLEVARTGRPQIALKLSIGPITVISNRTPLLVAGRIRGAVAVFQDITELEAISHQLSAVARLNEELNAIIESSYDGLYVTDGHAVTKRVNKAYLRITGLAEEELLGRSMDELVRAGYFDQSVTLEVLKRRQPVTLMQHIKGGKRVIVTGNPFFDERGEIRLVVTNVRDITELEELREKLESTRRLTERYYSELAELRLRQLEMEDVVARSEAMRQVLEKALTVSKVDSTVLLLGESGVGKEVVAKLIHRSGERRDGPFIKINCGAIPEPLMEAECFGYERGAFTGAGRDGKPGLFELADKGTLFLDEVGDLPLALQVKLLRVLEDRVLYRVGGIKPVRIDVRVIAATNRDIQGLVRERRFREDLYFRLKVVDIQIPPLRQRREDIAPLVMGALKKLSQRYGLQKCLSPAALAVFEAYDWPGNVRELEHLIENLAVLSKTNRIEVEDLPPAMLRAGSLPPAPGVQGATLRDTLARLEARLLQDALQAYGNTRDAARALGIDQSTVVRKLARHRLRGFVAEPRESVRSAAARQRT